MPFLSAALSSLCIGCGLQDQPTAVPSARIAAQVTVTPAAGDGCARLHVKVGPGSAATLTTIDNTSSCRSDELEVRVDSALVFDATTGVLRLPIVIKNLGTIPMGAPARLTFIADSAQLFDNDGNLIPGKPDIMAHNADSANASGRIGVWRYDSYLAPNGQPQVLSSGATSQRRWLELQATDWKNSVKISLSASALEPSTNVVPSVPPDSQPAGMYDASNVVYDSVTTGGPILKNTVLLVFRETATQAQRQALIDSVGGTVIGGAQTSPTTGFYYVRVATIQSVPELHAVVARLAASAHVDQASVILAIDIPSDYLRPTDGAGWSGWNVNPTFAGTGKREALERLYATHAWGCSIGGADVRVAVVDIDFRSYVDLPYNTTLSRGVGTVTTPVEHGTRVASILAARGDNNTGMVGVMWRSDLRLYERTVSGRASSPVAAARTELAIRHGARVVNLSFSLAQAWSTAAGGPLQWHGGNRVDSSFVRAFAQLFIDVLRQAKQAGTDPILVVSAGNFINVPARDAFWAGWGLVKQAYPDNVIIVGAAGLDATTLNATSGRGSFVTVAALGEDVYSLSSQNIDGTPVSGTSFSAPQVAGIAGLLLAFDSRLAAADIVQAIETAASLGTRRASGIPLANAYGALKKAALRPGSGTCANRVWLTNDSIYVQRESTNEAVFHAPPPALGVTAGHGSILGSGSTYIAFRNGQWIATTETLDPYDQGSPERSTSGYSHDRDSLAFLEPDPNGGWSYGLFATVLHSDSATPIPTVQRTLTTVPMSQRGGPSDCAAAVLQVVDNDSTYVCIEQGDFGVLRPSTNYTTDNETPVLSYSPLGDEILVAVPHLSNTFGSGSNLEFTPCPSYGAGYYCKSFDVRRRVDSTVVYSVKREGGAKARLFAVSGKKVFSIMLASDGAEVAMITGPALTGELFRGSAAVANTVFVQQGPCTTEFRRRDGTQAFSAPGAGCAFYGGTLAPKRRPPWVVYNPPDSRSDKRPRRLTPPR